MGDNPFAKGFPPIASKLGFCVAGNMAADVYGNGQPGDMGGRLFDIHSQTGLGAAEALGAYAEGIYLIEHFLFELTVKGLGVALADISAERFFSQICTFFKIAADTSSKDPKWI